MKEKDKKNKKENKKIEFSQILVMFATILSIAYLTYALLKVDSILTNINYLSTPLFIFALSLTMFIISIKSNIKMNIKISISIILIVFMAFNFMNDINIVKLPQEEQIVSYENVPYKSLNNWAKKNNIELSIEYEYSDIIETGNIIRLNVSEGTYAKKISKIIATVSKGPDYDKIVVVPSMIGWNIDNVTKFIKENNIIGVIVEYEFSDDIKDTVIKQDKNGDIRRDQEWILTLSLGNESELEHQIKMIDLKNMSTFDATLWLKRNNIKYSVEYEFSNTIERSIIIKQNINKDEAINIDDISVTITISKGKAIIAPNLLNMTIEEITNWITENKLKVSFEEIYDEKVEIGKVIDSTIKEKEKLEIGTLVKITISKGQIKMQNFSSLYEFKIWANKYQINYSESYEYSTSVEKGSVISYSYQENEIIDPDGIIYIKVSLGNAVTIPSFIGKSKSEATSICNNIGIRCTFNTGTYSSYQENVVYSQSRNQNTKVTKGSTITLTLSKGIPKTTRLIIQPNWFVIGNADSTIESLKKQFGTKYPGVNFKFNKVKDNTLANGLIQKSTSPTNDGDMVKQGETYTINIISN